MKIFLYLLAFLVIAFAAAPFLRPTSDVTPHHVEGLPWQIETLPDGSIRVFGLNLGQDRLGDAKAKLGEDMELAIVVAKDETGSLEMYYSHFKAGLLNGKLVLVGELDDTTLQQLRERSGLPKYLDSGARKYHLQTEDLPLAYQAPLQSITFIPMANIELDVAKQRFGPAGEVIRVDEETTHLLYPHLGLDLMINAQHKDVLQYVAPRDFERLRAPLLEAAQQP
jgi:hypothetical protein